MTRLNALETFPKQPKPCSPEEEQLVQANGKFGSNMMKGIFRKVPDQISPQEFQASLIRILGKGDSLIQQLADDHTFRQDTYIQLDRGTTREIEASIKKGMDLKPIFRVLSKNGIIPEQYSDLYLLIGFYEAGIAKKPVNDWSNKILGTNLQANTPVIYDGKRTNYLDAYLKFIDGETRAQIAKLKQRCMM